MKNNRQDLILQIIKNNVIKTQSELMDKLKEEGVKTTQATLSRDIRDLKLVKVPFNGGFKYESPSIVNIDYNEKYVRIINETVVSVDFSENIIVIKTYSGMAQAAAAAIDVILASNMLGSIAGDDTIFAVVKSKNDSEELTRTLRSFVK